MLGRRVGGRVVPALHSRLRKRNEAACWKEKGTLGVCSGQCSLVFPLTSAGEQFKVLVCPGKNKAC